MSASFDIQSAAGSYRVHIQSNGFAEFLRGFGDSPVLADEYFSSEFANMRIPAIFIDATEENKSLDATPPLIEKLRKLGANRQSEIVSVGGGIVQDLSTFIASVYMRGLAWSYLPTTILAMVDSCIGGKSSINVGPYKNLAGTFHPPRQVLIDPYLAQSLPPEQKASGLIEAAKICFCRGEESFERHLSYGPSVNMDTDALEALIVNSLQSKKWFIEIDEFDKNERLLLNFGHTFGHALEGATHFAISHGIAVGLGILCALSFARDQGTNYDGNRRVKALENHLQEIVSSIPALSDHLLDMSLDDVCERFASDKKHGQRHYTIVAVAQTGTVVLRKIERLPEVAFAVKKSVKSVIERFV